MQWFQSYDLFLFDLDGLLVNSEELHFQAYKEMLRKRGFSLDWDFPAYFQIAQQDALAPRRAIYKEFPALEKMEPNWDILYAEKKEAYRKILTEHPVPLLPGVERFITELKAKNKELAVVTHTARPLVALIREKNPLLNTITHWFTREDYDKPKPSPDGYLKAIELLAEPKMKVIGFEDSVRGMRALLQTTATAVYVNSMDPATKAMFEQEGVHTFSNMDEFFNTRVSL